MVRSLAAGAGAHVGTYTADGISRETLELASREGWTAYGVIPIRVGKQLEGIIAVYFDQPLASLEFDERGLDLIGRIASISLANFRLRERLTTSEQSYRTLFDQSPEALVLLSADAEVVTANRAALELYRTDVAGLVAYGAIGGPRLDVAEARRRAVLLATPGQRTHRRTGSRPDGSTFPQEVIVTPLVADGQQRYLILVRDLTDEERLQGELLQAQKMEALGQLVAGVAHELNNPLASIVAFSQLIRGDERLPQDLRRDADLLKQEADRTRRIVGSLLDFARRRPPERVATSVRTRGASVLELQSYGIASANVAIELDLPADLPASDVDRSQLQQVLLNLTLNANQAIRATGRPGTIAIAARPVTGADGLEMVCLSITDDGPGVEPDVRSRLFLPFFTTREPGEGTGLGLSVSFGIVAAHGGRLWFEPGPDARGASFLMELPVHSTMAAAAAPPAPPARDESVPAVERVDAPPPPTPTRPRVLVLDDEPAIRAFLTKVLRLGNFDPVVTQFGQEAIERAAAESFDVVLVDHRMPGMSGTEVYEAVVAIRPELADRFVYMSGDVLNPELQSFAEGREIGLLAKPFDIETALRVVGAVVARR
jgi:two-component system NtrC family sensor kinase